MEKLEEDLQVRLCPALPCLALPYLGLPCLALPCLVSLLYGVLPVPYIRLCVSID